MSPHLLLDPHLRQAAEVVVQIHRLENPSCTVAQQSKRHLNWNDWSVMIDGYQWLFHGFPIC